MELPEDEIQQSAARDIATAHLSTLIEDAGEALARSVANLAIDGAALPMRSPADRASAGIGHEIDRLTEQLAAICFEHLEESIDQRPDHPNMNIDGEAFENELSVRDPLPDNI
jgi:hypothetical protein